MTKHDLQQVRFLASEVRILRERLKVMEAQIGCGALVQDGMPKGNKIGRPVENQAIRIAETITLIQTHEQEIQALRDEVWRFVSGLDDSLLRQIIILRFIDGKSWQKVADVIGGGVTADNCRMIYRRSDIDN